MASPPADSSLIRRALSDCPAGAPGWKTFEDVALSALCHLFVPPLIRPVVQARTLSGIDRRDAIFSNRITDSACAWGLLRQDHDARLIPVEFKNYDRERIGKDEVDQVCGYLKSSMGRLAIICCNKRPDRSAYIRRNSVFSQHRTVVLFLTTEDLIEMLDIKDRGDDPSDFVIDRVEQFLIEHE
jgi:hypothetical protein